MGNMSYGERLKAPNLYSQEIYTVLYIFGKFLKAKCQIYLKKLNLPYLKEEDVTV